MCVNGKFENPVSLLVLKQRKTQGLRAGLHRETFTSKARIVKNYLEKVPKGEFTEYLTLAIIISIAVIIRLLPLRWGFYLSEFDPYQQYRQALHISENGYTSWFTWHDEKSWFPWGRDTPTTNYAGIPFTAVILYDFLTSLGITMSLYDFCVIFPIILAAATCVAIYIFTKEVWGKVAGLFAALLIGLSSSHITRTSLGFFDDETVGIFLALLIFTFFLKAISKNRSYKATFTYSVLGALSTAYLAASWGAFRYIVSILALFTFVLIILRKSSPKLLVTYGTTLGLGYLFMGQIPRLGYSFFYEWISAVILGVFILLLFVEGAKRITIPRNRFLVIGIILIILISSGAFLWQRGVIAGSAGKFLTILNPTTRFQMPLVESVAEHRPATWASFFLEFGVFITLGTFGLYFATRRLQEGDIFLILFGVTSAYFAASLVRLTLLMAPAFAVLAAIALGELGKPAMDVLKETVIFPKKRIRLPSKVGKEFGASIILIILIITMPTFYYSIQSAYAPTTIATSSIPVAPSGDEATRYQDWLQALAWMRENLPDDAVIFSWWDYGYWITAIGKKNSLADNGTINSTQIAVIACTFLAPENRSVPILKRYRVSEVAIFATWTSDEQGGIRYYGYGEDNKWYWMARIGNGTVVNGEVYNFYQRLVGEDTIYLRTIRAEGKLVSNETIADSTGIQANTMLGKLIQEGINPESEKSEYFTNSFTSQNRFVFLWNVQYLNETRIGLNLEKSSMVYGEGVRIYGTLEDLQGQPLEGKRVILEYSRNLGETWDTLLGTTTESDGGFRVSADPNVGGYLIRARWDGEPKRYRGATSIAQNLNVTPAISGLSVDLPSKVPMGERANITAQLAAKANTGNLTIQYSEDGAEWRTIQSGQPVNGSFTAVWTPEKIGEYSIRATWSGDFNYDPSVSEEQTVTVE